MNVKLRRSIYFCIWGLAIFVFALIGHLGWKVGGVLWTFLR